MPISIQCPTCSKRYDVSAKHLGKKVVCTCGDKFVATEPDDEENAFDGLDEFEDIPMPPPITSKAVETIAEPSVQVDPNDVAPVAVRVCRFGILGRLFLFCGLMILAVGAQCPSTVYHSGSLMFNAPQAMTKLTVVLIGLATTISGAALWSGSKAQPSIVDLIIGLFVVVGLLAGTILTLV